MADRYPSLREITLYCEEAARRSQARRRSRIDIGTRLGDFLASDRTAIAAVVVICVSVVVAVLLGGTR
jgi:hypothetical protein